MRKLALRWSIYLEKLHLGEYDKKNLAKAVSGFANSSGGVLVWGIEDKKLSPKPIKNIQSFVSDLINLAPQVTDPIVGDIEGDWIPSDNFSTEGTGFGLILIPESILPPHRVILKNTEIQHHYYIRSGDMFVIAPHIQLEDMFGRRPKPKLVLYKNIIKGGMKGQLLVILGIENQGRGSAKGPYMSVKINDPYKIHEGGLDGNLHFGLDKIISSQPTNEKKYGSSANILLHSGVVLEVTVVKADINELLKTQSGVQDLIIDYKVAAEGTGLIEGQDVLGSNKLIDKANLLWG